LLPFVCFLQFSSALVWVKNAFHNLGSLNLWGCVQLNSLSAPKSGPGLGYECPEACRFQKKFIHIFLSDKQTNTQRQRQKHDLFCTSLFYGSRKFLACVTDDWPWRWLLEVL